MQDDENRALKDRICSGNFVQRNKLIVKGGSSFNGLVRAIKVGQRLSGNCVDAVLHCLCCGLLDDCRQFCKFGNYRHVGSLY